MKVAAAIAITAAVVMSAVALYVALSRQQVVLTPSHTQTGSAYDQPPMP